MGILLSYPFKLLVNHIPPVGPTSVPLVVVWDIMRLQRSTLKWQVGKCTANAGKAESDDLGLTQDKGGGEGKEVKKTRHWATKPLHVGRTVLRSGSVLLVTVGQWFFFKAFMFRMM